MGTNFQLHEYTPVNNETEIIKVIHVSSKFYGPGLTKWPQGMMPLTPP